MPRLTIILSTYNRPQSLQSAISSIMHQSYDDWQILVIGDKCSDETGRVLGDIDDPRIKYINLEDRCGEQSGPNSVGIGLAQTELVAFMNHDDFWLPDHLQTAVDAIDAEDLDFYCSGAVLTTYAQVIKSGKSRPAFAVVTPVRQSLGEIFFKSAVIFEPVSSWVAKTDYVQQVGLWKPARTLFRSPIEDWLLRVWRKGGNIKLSNQPTVIYCNAEKRRWVHLKKHEDKKLYEVELHENCFWQEYMAEHGYETLKTLMTSDTSSVSRKAPYFQDRYEGKANKWLFDALVNRKTARVFYRTGWDAFEKFCDLTKQSKGGKLGIMLQRRTGEVLPDVESWAPLVEKVKSLTCDDAEKESVDVGQ